MTKKLVSLFLALVMAFSLTAAFAESTALTVTDMTGREITLEEPRHAHRCAHGRPTARSSARSARMDLLVGRGTYCDYPAAVLEIPVGAVRRMRPTWSRSSLLSRRCSL